LSPWAGAWGGHEVDLAAGRVAFVAILVGRIIFAAVFVHWPAG
jgi:hypothetical protein